MSAKSEFRFLHADLVARRSRPSMLRSIRDVGHESSHVSLLTTRTRDIEHDRRGFVCPGRRKALARAAQGAVQLVPTRAALHAWTGAALGGKTRHSRAGWAWHQGLEHSDLNLRWLRKSEIVAADSPAL